MRKHGETEKERGKYRHKLYYAKFIEINTWKLPISRDNNTRNYQLIVIAVN